MPKITSIGFGESRFGHHASEAAQATGEGVDLVDGALDDEGDDCHRAVVEREALATKDNVAEIGKDGIDESRLRAVGDQKGDSTYSLLHQVKSFWVRKKSYGCKDTNIFCIFAKRKAERCREARERQVGAGTTTKYNTTCTNI